MSEPLGTRGTSLATWIAALRSELLSAAITGRNKQPQFAIHQIDLELEVVSTRDDDERGEIKFWVVGLEKGQKRTSEGTQRIKLSLIPETLSGEVVRVQDQLQHEPE